MSRPTLEAADVVRRTGNSSAERAASHFARAFPWHLGQCRLRHELNEMA